MVQKQVRSLRPGIVRVNVLHVGASLDGHAVQVPHLRLGRFAQELLDSLAHENHHPVLLAGAHHAGGHVDVGREIGGVDLVLAAHRTLDGPTGVHAENHVDRPLLPAPAAASPQESDFLADLLRPGQQPVVSVHCGKGLQHPDHGAIGKRRDSGDVLERKPHGLCHGLHGNVFFGVQIGFQPPHGLVVARGTRASHPRATLFTASSLLDVRLSSIGGRKDDSGGLF
mmetsp:Transcript_28243/g.60607  ORF Transcript_28243/g.60607 Transcript_28243/m.60607 type:complete len:226 (-) Transcript_28243:1031-1708(-)